MTFLNRVSISHVFYEHMLLFRGGESPHSLHSYLLSARSFKTQWIGGTCDKLAFTPWRVIPSPC